MKHLTIYRLMFTRSDCYNKSGRQQQHGVQVHSTSGNNPYLKRYVGPDDGRLGKNIYGNYHNRPGGDVCASAYIGRLQDGTVAVYQALPWDLRCWLSGQGPNGNANRMGYIGFEIAENKNDDAYFWDAVMDKSVLLTAYLCQMLGVTPWTVVKETKDGPAIAVMDHIELHDVGVASNHGDISHWLRMYGLNMNDYRKAVEAVLEEGITVDYVDCHPIERTTLRKGDSGDDVRKMQRLLVANGYALKPTKTSPDGCDGIFGADTEAAVMAFQADNGLTADGICGPKTWTALEKGEQETPEVPDTPPEISDDNPQIPPDDSGYVSVKRETLEEIRRLASDILSALNTIANG